jgi:hypothetical protein
MSKANKREILVEKVVCAIAKYDTSQLFNLVDTSYCFDIYGRESFIYKVDYINKKLKLCGSFINKDSMSIKVISGTIIQYNIPFCKRENKSNADDEFELICQFSDNFSPQKLICLDIVTHLPITPTRPVNLEK